MGFDFKAPAVLESGVDVRIGRVGSGPEVTAWFDDTIVE
jgi:hypothetical protein